jgi:hypothetical protein
VFGYVMSLLLLYSVHIAQPSPKKRQYLCSPSNPPQPKGFLQQFPCMKSREEGRGVVPLPARLNRFPLDRLWAMWGAPPPGKWFDGTGCQVFSISASPLRGSRTQKLSLSYDLLICAFCIGGNMCQQQYKLYKTVSKKYACQPHSKVYRKPHIGNT